MFRSRQVPALHQLTRRVRTSWSRTRSTRWSSSSTSPSPSSTCSTPSAGDHRIQNPWRRGRKTCPWSLRRSLPQVMMIMVINVMIMMMMMKMMMVIHISSSGEESENGIEKKEAVWSNRFLQSFFDPLPKFDHLSSFDNISSFGNMTSFDHLPSFDNFSESVLIFWSVD